LYLFKDENVAEADRDMLSKEVKSKIGKVMGIGGGVATATISLQKLDYKPGEKIKVLIVMDNCVGKAVKSYKLKLNRTYSAYADADSFKPVFEKSEYVVLSSEKGCPPKAKESRELLFTIPDQEDWKRRSDTGNLHSELNPLLTQFTASNEANIFKVRYNLDVFVKHDAWNEFGMGNHVTFNINVCYGQTYFAELHAHQEAAIKEQHGQWKPLEFPKILLTTENDKEVSKPLDNATFEQIKNAIGEKLGVVKAKIVDDAIE